MKLDEFVKEALVGIAKGVVEAQEELISYPGVVINPKGFERPSSNPGIAIKQMEGYVPNVYAEIIQFDVAVTVESGLKASIEGGAEGSAGIQVLSIDLAKASGEVNAGLSHNSTNSFASRLKFAVPLQLPSHPGWVDK